MKVRRTGWRGDDAGTDDGPERCGKHVRGSGKVDLFLWLRANMQRVCGELREEIGGGRDEIEGRPPNARPEGG